MKSYINKIKKNESISYAAFLKKCTKHKITDTKLRSIFSIATSPCKKKNKYLLTIKDEEAFNKTFSKFMTEASDVKVEAALHGDSKIVKSERSLLIWKEHHYSINSVGIEFDKSNYNFHTLKKNKLIIIENLNNFLNIESNFDNDIDLYEYNFVWGSGNNVTNKHFVEFLNEYKEIVCLFDIDLGGLKFYKSLEKQVKTNLQFYFTPKMELMVKKFGKPISISDYETLMKHYTKTNGLKYIVSFIKETKKFAEQEIFQYNN
ncbi:MAG: hypothetical protein CL760_00865 [Chloroflexi bacterium]|nr:hypothetical protein [Chloroflexota bacterium]|tara:strand:+ start:28219 stop:29001 length:783 start_codon:yes stop_codon:yes gene_type:complete